METKLQILEHRLKIIQSKKITMIPYYCEDSKRRELESCRKEIEFEENNKGNYGYEEDNDDDYSSGYVGIN